MKLNTAGKIAAYTLIIFSIGLAIAFIYPITHGTHLPELDPVEDIDTRRFPENPLLAKCPQSTGFDYPVGKPNADNYYNALPFGKNYHLGDDWNGVNGGNTDLGDPVYAVSDGIVSFADDVGGGWGNVVRIYHNIGNTIYVESLYGHLDEVLVKYSDLVQKGQKIGTIGNVDGKYYAHLHFEIRSELDKPIGGGYSANTEGYLDPTQFINNHRLFSGKSVDQIMLNQK